MVMLACTGIEGCGHDRSLRDLAAPYLSPDAIKSIPAFPIEPGRRRIILIMLANHDGSVEIKEWSARSDCVELWEWHSETGKRRCVYSARSQPIAFTLRRLIDLACRWSCPNVPGTNGEPSNSFGHLMEFCDVLVFVGDRIAVFDIVDPTEDYLAATVEMLHETSSSGVDSKDADTDWVEDCFKDMTYQHPGHMLFEAVNRIDAASREIARFNSTGNR